MKKWEFNFQTVDADFLGAKTQTAALAFPEQLPLLF